jgi:hypothetical protein
MDFETPKRVIKEQLGMGAIEGIDLQEMQGVVHKAR